MGDLKDKFKGFMKKVNNQMSTSSSGKFKGQGRVLGSSSELTNQNNPRPYVNPHRNLSQPTTTNSVNLKPVPQKVDNSNTTVSNPSVEGENSVNSIPNLKLSSDLVSSREPVDGFDPYDSLITTGKRNKNGFSLANVFECPVCNCSFESEEEVSVHIESCIGEKSSNVGGSVGVDLGLDSEGGSEVKPESMGKLEACIGIYLSGCPAESSNDVVLRLLRNIVKEPENPKFRRIRMSNPKIREAVGDVAGGLELLELVGFQLKEEEGEMWAAMETPSEESIFLLKETTRLLERSKNVGGLSSTSVVKGDEKVEAEKVKTSEPKVVDRQVKVFFPVPESIAARIELPDSFYNLSLEEVRREAEMRKKKMADSQLLIPKSYREKQAQATRRRYNRTIIRVQFPDGVVLQGVFSPREPTTALYEFVSSALKQQGLEFELVHPIPVKRRVIPCFPSAGQKLSTLEEEDLVPSALVKFKPLETDTMVFTGLVNELLELSEPLGSEAT